MTMKTNHISSEEGFPSGRHADRYLQTGPSMRPIIEQQTGPTQENKYTKRLQKLAVHDETPPRPTSE